MKIFDIICEQSKTPVLRQIDGKWSWEFPNGEKLSGFPNRQSAVDWAKSDTGKAEFAKRSTVVPSTQSTPSSQPQQSAKSSNGNASVTKTTTYRGTAEEVKKLIQADQERYGRLSDDEIVKKTSQVTGLSPAKSRAIRKLEIFVSSMTLLAPFIGYYANKSFWIKEHGEEDLEIFQSVYMEHIKAQIGIIAAGTAGIFSRRAATANALAVIAVLGTLTGDWDTPDGLWKKILITAPTAFAVKYAPKIALPIIVGWLQTPAGRTFIYNTIFNSMFGTAWDAMNVIATGVLGQIKSNDQSDSK